MEYRDKILILTPVKDAAAFLEEYFVRLDRLTYPHRQLSIAFLESDSHDRTYEEIERRLPDLRTRFRVAGLWKRDFGFHLPPNTPRWANHVQLERRAALAKSRNHLLLRALDDEDWVLWLDVDVIEYPRDIIERLLDTGKDIVQPHCVEEYGGRSFDRSAWRDKGRFHLDDLRREGDLVRLHTVGGTMLLVRADVHRDGLIFPTFPYGKQNPLIRQRNHFLRKRDILLLKNVQDVLRGRYRGEIETEGLGMMAHDMGYKCWGMPNTEIRHGEANGGEPAVVTPGGEAGE